MSVKLTTRINAQGQSSFVNPRLILVLLNCYLEASHIQVYLRLLEAQTSSPACRHISLQ
jgi:hypothetical protein